MIPHEVIVRETAGLSDNHLFDLARNPSAPIETRKFAAAKLLTTGAYQAAKAEISGLIAEIKAEQTTGTAVAEKRFAEVAETNSGEPSSPESDTSAAPSASFTTSSIQ